MILLLSELPLILTLTFVFIFGVIIGSFLNVYIYRFHTGKSLSGSSHCLSCGTSLKAYELVPLFSYLFLRGRCRTCQAVIPSRYFLVELLTGFLFVGVFLNLSGWFTVAWFLIIMAVLVVVVVYDLYHMIIPNELVVALLVLAFGYEFYNLLVESLSINFIYNLVSAFFGSLFLFVLWKFSEGRWVGFGDVKLVFPLGILVGYKGVFSMFVLSFWVGAIVGLLLLLFQSLQKRGKPHLRFLSRELTIKSAVPFAPFLVSGFLLVLFFSIDVIALITYVP